MNNDDDGGNDQDKDVQKSNNETIMKGFLFKLADGWFANLRALSCFFEHG